MGDTPATIDPTKKSANMPADRSAFLGSAAKGSVGFTITVNWSRRCASSPARRMNHRMPDPVEEVAPEGRQNEKITAEEIHGDKVLRRDHVRACEAGLAKKIHAARQLSLTVKGGVQRHRDEDDREEHAGAAMLAGRGERSSSAPWSMPRSR